jgi:oxygen-independent coproporphyrinogen-3 oxidase
MSAVSQALDKAQTLGLLERDMHKVWPTERGFDMLSDVQALFLPA